MMDILEYSPEQMQELLSTAYAIESGLLLAGAGLFLTWGSVMIAVLRRTQHRRAAIKSWCQLWGIPAVFIFFGLVLMCFSRLQM